MRTRESIRQTGTVFEAKVIRGSVSKDNVRILVPAPSIVSPSEWMRRIKGRASFKLFEEFSHVKKRYWGGHFWARGYFCVTVGELTKPMIEEYADHHFESKEHPNFEIEGESALADVWWDFQSLRLIHRFLVGGC